MILIRKKFVEGARSLPLKMIGAVAALVITALVFAGYTLLRKRHAETSPQAGNAPVAEARKPPKALVIVDEALLQGGKTVLGGTVKNTTKEKLDGLAVELELKPRVARLWKRSCCFASRTLEPQQEVTTRTVESPDYSYARLVGLKDGTGAVPYTSAPGQKRPLERLETKTVTIGKPSPKSGEFLNSPDNPARVP